MPAGRIYPQPKIFEKIHSFCIGVDKYDSLSPLSGCINDIHMIHNILSTHKDGIHKILENPSRESIFLTLNMILKNLSKGELLIIHASGHGTLLYNEFYYLPKEANRDNILGTGISIYTLIKALSHHAQQGCKVLLLLDTCNAGGVSFDISTYQGEFKGGISCIFSSIAQENSYEIKIDGQSRGLFSYFIGEGLRGKAINYFPGNEDVNDYQKGNLKLIDLYDYTYDHVLKYGLEMNLRHQYPLLIGTLESDTIIHEVK